MRQLRFDWKMPDEPITPARPLPELDPETIQAVLALMAHVLLAVARAAEEVARDR